MPRSEEANQRIREEQRAKILEAAQKVFMQKGRAATMADVAAEAAISQGLAYRYFKNKEEIFNKLVEQTMQSSNERMQGILEMPGTPGERLDILITGLLDARRENPRVLPLFYQTIFNENSPTEIRELVEKQGLLFQSVLRQLIVEGQATGEVVDEDPDQLMIVVIAFLEGLWRIMSFIESEQNKRIIPEARIVLRMLRIYPDKQ